MLLKSRYLQDLVSAIVPFARVGAELQRSLGAAATLPFLTAFYLLE